MILHVCITMQQAGIVCVELSNVLCVLIILCVCTCMSCVCGCVCVCVCVFAEGLSHLHNAVSTLLQSYITLSAEVSNIPVHCSSYNYIYV